MACTVIQHRRRYRPQLKRTSPASIITPLALYTVLEFSLITDKEYQYLNNVNLYLAKDFMKHIVHPQYTGKYSYHLHCDIYHHSNMGWNYMDQLFVEKYKTFLPK